MYTLHRQRIAIMFTGALLLSIKLFYIHGIILGITGFIIFSFGFASIIGALINKQTGNKDISFYLGLFILIAYLILANSIFYYIYAITPLISIIILWIPLILSLKNTKEYIIPIPKWEKENKNTASLFVFFIFTQLGLLTTLFQGQTTGLLRSPWHAVSPEFFILYAISTSLLIAGVYKTKNSISKYLFTALHLFTTYAIAVIIYKVGFGFDAFIHRATEIWIQEFGAISPKQPYYIGQYGLVVWLSNITSIPIFYIDVYLVPVLSAITLPIIIPFTISKIFNIGKEFAMNLIWALPFLPFLFFNLTTPYNFALLFTILSICLTLLYIRKELPMWAPLLSAITTIIIHPLIGAPTCLFILYGILMKKNKKLENVRSARIITALSIVFDMAILLPILFTIQIKLSGYSFPKITNPFSRINEFMQLFARPYWFANHAPLRFEILYAWQYIIPIIFLSFAIYGLFLRRKKIESMLCFYSALGLFLSAWLLRSWFIFPDVASYEQGDYPIRLIKASLLFILPFAFFGIHKFISYFLRKKNGGVVVVIISGAILTLSFYLAYPQHNQKARFPGLNVTLSDFKTVSFIHNDNSEYNYVVLANQLVSATALQKYSFIKYFSTNQGEQFYYSIPTGGPLYQLYGDMLYKGQKRETMITAMNLVKVDKAYFVINSYWANSEKIIDGAKKTANEWQIIDGGAIWIFKYLR